MFDQNKSGDVIEVNDGAPWGAPMGSSVGGAGAGWTSYG